jgi:hypothetical protein
MPEKSSENREAIIRKNNETIGNYSVVLRDISKARGKFDAIEGKIDENVDRLGKANRVYESLPEELFSKPSPVLHSLIASGSELAGGLYAHSEYFKDHIQKISDETDSLIGTAAVSDISGNTTSNVLISIAKIAVLQDPKIGELIEELELPSPFEKRKDLESDLRKIKKQLADMYVGAWQTIGDTSKQDRFSQAANSMRNLLSQLLDILAPPEKVKKADWYKPELNEETKKIRKKPTQRSRAKYAIMGERSKETLDEEDLKMITVLMDDARNAYEFLSNPAHARNEEIFTFTKSYMERCEEVIRSILELRKRFYISSQ